MIKISSGNAAMDLGFMHEMRMQGWTKKQASVMYDYALQFNSAASMVKSAAVIGVPDNPEASPLGFLKWAASARERYAWCNEPMIKYAGPAYAMGQFAGNVVNGVNHLGDRMSEGYNAGRQFMNDLPGNIAYGIGAAGGAIHNGYDAAKQGLSDARDWAGNKIQQGRQWLDEKNRQADEWYQQKRQGMIDTYNNAKDWAHNKVQQGWDAAKQGVRDARDWAGNKLQQGYDAAKEGVNAAYNKGKEMAQSTGNFFSRMWNKGKEAYNSAKQGVQNAYNATKQGISDAKDWAVNKAQQGAQWAGDKYNQATQWASDKAQQGAQWAADKAQQGAQWAGEKYDQAKQWAQGIGDDISRGYHDARNNR